MNPWHWHPSVVAGLAGLVAGYWFATRRRRATPGQVASFTGGVAALAAALLGPLAEWAEHVALSAHMLQHLVLTLVVPPLWLAGTPAGLLRPLLRVPGARITGRVLTHPAVAFGVAAAVLVVWHRPVFFEAAARSEAVHVLSHLTLIGSGLSAWWPVAGPLPEWPRPSPPAQLLYLFLSTIPMAAIAAPITLAEEPLYPFYAAASVAAGWPLAPQADQELAGVLMWVVGPFAYLIAGTIVFFRWASLEEAEAGAVSAPRPR
jgi:putative membrane protein